MTAKAQSRRVAESRSGPLTSVDVWRRLKNNIKIPEPVLITIDIVRLGFVNAIEEQAV